jgi:hypothetical protein
MEYRHLGRTGLRVSTLSYGAWVTFGNQLNVKDAVGILSRCREAGVNFFDNAEVYAEGKAEEIMGAAIKQAGWKRSDLVISTKLFWGGSGPNDKGLSRKHIIEGTKVSRILVRGSRSPTFAVVPSLAYLLSPSKPAFVRSYNVRYNILFNIRNLDLVAFAAMDAKNALKYRDLTFYSSY